MQLAHSVSDTCGALMRSFLGDVDVVKGLE